MASLLWTILLVSVAVPCVNAAAKALDEACTAGTDTCSDAEAVCENAKCRLKENEGCTGKTDKCITNAECTGTSGSETCSCKTGFTVNTDKDRCEADLGSTCSATTSCKDAGAVCDASDSKCRLKVDQTCTGNTDKCITNAGCTGSTNTKCACSTGYNANSDKTACAVIGTGKVGRTCNTGNAAQECPTASNLECDTTTTNECVCKTGYTGPRNGDCSVKSGAVELVGSLVTVTLAAILHIFIRH